ncbi:MAG: hypothetical protein ACO3C6_06790, partial [Steroidobacteraceae bacterium]
EEGALHKSVGHSQGSSAPSVEFVHKVLRANGSANHDAIAQPGPRGGIDLIPELANPKDLYGLLRPGLAVRKVAA